VKETTRGAHLELSVVTAHASFERTSEPGEEGQHARFELLELGDSLGGDADDLREKHPHSLPDSRETVRPLPWPDA
jgi:hypothetical protein